MDQLIDRLKEWCDQVVVVDCGGPFVVVGTLAEVTNDYLELRDADMHDLRDTETNRELYVEKTARHGVQVNRAVLILRMSEVVGMSRLADVSSG